MQELLASREPSVRLRTQIEILGQSPAYRTSTVLQDKIRHSERVTRLLSERQSNGKLPFHPYAKWYGAHWILSILADLRYPAGDKSLIPLREQIYDWLFSKQNLASARTHHNKSRTFSRNDESTRVHASMEGNAVYYLNALGLAEEKTSELADRLLDWQWPDGGWNCDKNPSAHTSSFTESLLPLRGLSFHFASSGGSSYQKAARKAAEFFLERRLYKRRRDGRVISAKFTMLHYPCYWHYDILFGLKVMREAGFIRDRRCMDAVSLLQSKRLNDDGGFPAEGAYNRKSERKRALAVARSSIGEE